MGVKAIQPFAGQDRRLSGLKFQKRLVVDGTLENAVLMAEKRGVRYNQMCDVLLFSTYMVRIA